MCCDFLGLRLQATTASAVKSIDYALSKKVKIINNSWAGSVASKALTRSLQFAAKAHGGKGVLVVNSAGNDAQNLDSSSVYPASIELPNSIK